MPWEHGTYFSEADERKARDFLASQGLTEDQVNGVGSWHRSQVGGQLSLWVGAAMLMGAVIGFLVAKAFEQGCALF